MSNARTNWRGVMGVIVAITGVFCEICAVLSHEYPEPPGVTTIFVLMVGVLLIVGGTAAVVTSRKGGDGL